MRVSYTLTEQDYVRGLEAGIRSGRKLFSLPDLLVWAVTAAILIAAVTTISTVR